MSRAAKPRRDVAAESAAAATLDAESTRGSTRKRAQRLPRTPQLMMNIEEPESDVVVDVSENDTPVPEELFVCIHR